MKHTIDTAEIVRLLKDRNTLLVDPKIRMSDDGYSGHLICTYRGTLKSCFFEATVPGFASAYLSRLAQRSKSEAEIAAELAAQL